MTDITYYIFEEKYNELLYKLFDYIYPLEMQRLNRIDYKLDYKTEHKDLYIKLLKKANLQYRHLKQEREYNSSVYLTSGTRHVNIYDRGQYCIDKGKSIEQLVEYHNVLRYEAQVKKRRIDRYKLDLGLINCLWNYCNPYDMNFFINDVIVPVIYQGNYYNLYHSNKILKEHYTRSMTNDLLELQKSISLYGVKSTKENYKYTVKTFNQHIKRLEQVGVNPVPIPKNEGITYLHNPLHIAA